MIKLTINEYKHNTYSVLILGISPSCEGIVPDNWLFSRSRCLSLFNVPISSGTEPIEIEKGEQKLWHSFHTNANVPPENRFWLRRSSRRFVKLCKLAGIGPKNDKQHKPWTNGTSEKKCHVYCNNPDRALMSYHSIGCSSGIAFPVPLTG